MPQSSPAVNIRQIYPIPTIAHWQIVFSVPPTNIDVTRSYIFEIGRNLMIRNCLTLRIGLPLVLAVAAIFVVDVNEAEGQLFRRCNRFAQRRCCAPSQCCAPIQVTQRCYSPCRSRCWQRPSRSRCCPVQNSCCGGCGSANKPGGGPLRDCNQEYSICCTNCSGNATCDGNTPCYLQCQHEKNCCECDNYCSTQCANSADPFCYLNCVVTSCPFCGLGR